MGVFDNLFNADQADTGKSKYEPPVAKLTAGMQTASGAPKNLSTWRITSEDHNILSAVSELFGGEVRSFKTPRASGEHVITNAHDIEAIVDGPDDVEVAAILWENSRPAHKCDFRVFLNGTGTGTPGEPCGCGDYTLRELKRRAKDGEGPSPSMRIDFRLAQDPELGKFRFQNGSWGLAKNIDAFRDAVVAAGEPVVALISKAYRSFEDQDTGELVEYREIVPTVTGTLNDEIAS